MTWLTWLVHMCDMTYSSVHHARRRYRVVEKNRLKPSRASAWVLWFISIAGVETYYYTWYDALACVTWLINMWVMTQSYVWQDSSIYVTWLIHMCDMTHSYMWHDAFLRVTCLFWTCDRAVIQMLTKSSQARVQRLMTVRPQGDDDDDGNAGVSMCQCVETCHTYEWVISHLWMSHVKHMNESFQTYEWVMSHTWMSHFTLMNESFHTYEWAISHVASHIHSHVAHMKKSYHTNKWVIVYTMTYVMTHLYVSF